jgi:Holliday junction resolvase-like predicted endonuclease
MKEEFLFNPMVNYLEKNGYQIIEQHRGHEKGTDIIAEKNGTTLFLELKGDSAAYDVDFGTMIYQIMKKMNAASNDEFALGVSENYRKHAIRCRFPLQKLKIKVFVINENNVEMLF